MIIINYIIIIIIKNGDFLTEDKIKSFNNKEEAEILLEKSRNHIDEIDNELMDLISQRTSLAKDIALSKEYLGMPVYDKSREEAIHNKIKRMAMENDLDERNTVQQRCTQTKLSSQTQILQYQMESDSLKDFPKHTLQPNTDDSTKRP